LARASSSIACDAAKRSARLIDISRRLIDHDLGMSLRIGCARLRAGIIQRVEIDREVMTQSAGKTGALHHRIDIVGGDCHRGRPANFAAFGIRRQRPQAPGITVLL
jgi:hypothetical protein